MEEAVGKEANLAEMAAVSHVLVQLAINDQSLRQ
jgi:hypothetical protein